MVTKWLTARRGEKMRERAEDSSVVRRLHNGQITIPVAFRRRLGLEDGAPLEVVLVGSEVRLRPQQIHAAPPAGSQWFKDLYDLFAPVREAAVPLSEEEIDAVISQTIDEVRAERAARRA